ncbi:MAG: sugar nucleotide-binding protein [Planctomycetaceae bacterium]|nr:sugar nucleotide-binding protein [Planctomycetaceae bacterium]
MDTLLIAGIDTVAGSNIANALSNSYNVIGLSFTTPVSFAGSETELCPGDSEAEISACLQNINPNWILYCGPAACSSWEVEPAQLRNPALVEDAKLWAAAAKKAGCRFTAISSDAIFTGPWMFHTEESRCYCSSPEAQNLLKMEKAISTACPNATIVRTHVFGWTPEKMNSQSIDQVLQKLEAGEEFPGTSYSSPILGAQLADILVKLEERKLNGTFHIGSAERCNPQQFAAHVALEFGLTAPGAESLGAISTRPAGFGQGETSLQCTKLRKVLGIGLPLVSDGIRLLAIEREKQAATYPGFYSAKAA